MRPRAFSARTRLLPMKPAAPVTTIKLDSPSARPLCCRAVSPTATPEELQAFAADGYFVRERVLHEPELEHLRAGVERVHERVLAAADVPDAAPIERVDDKRYQDLLGSCVKWEWDEASPRGALDGAVPASRSRAARAARRPALWASRCARCAARRASRCSRTS